MWEDDDAKRGYWKSLQKAIGKSLTKGQRQQLRPVRPESLRLVQIRGKVLSDAVVELKHSPEDRNELMEQLATSLQERLYLLSKSAPDQLKLPLGELVCFEDQVGRRGRPLTSEQTIGSEFEGWKGFRARYPVCDENGNVTPQRQLALEGSGCSEAITNANPWLEPVGVLAHPKVILIQNPFGVDIPTQRLYKLNAKLEQDEAFPSELTFGDSIVTMQKTPDPADVIVLPTRNLADVDLARAA